MIGIWYGYVLGAAVVVVGVLVLTGVLLDAAQPPMVRTIFGLVMMLFGVYRIVLADGRRRQRKREEEAEQ